MARAHSGTNGARPPARWLALRAAALAVLLGWAQAAGAEQSLEYQVKAAFLLNFTKFIEWPAAAFPSAEAPFSICIAGEDPFGGVLDRIVEGETVNGRKLAILRVRLPLEHSCQILFVERLETGTEALPRGPGSGVLTVGEGSSFLRSGGMIAFQIENRRVRFDINQTAAANAGLKVSSKLLRIARSVEK